MGRFQHRSAGELGGNQESLLCVHVCTSVPGVFTGSQDLQQVKNQQTGMKDPFCLNSLITT